MRRLTSLIRRQAAILGFFGLFLGAIPSGVEAQTTLRVPQDEASLQRAMDQLRRRGGVIEISAGTYSVPGGSFRLRHPGGTLTLRAVGGDVILDGEGLRPVFRFENDDRSRGTRVFFEGITFRGGKSDEEQVSGGVTLVEAEASFLGCRFIDNRSNAPSTGGSGTLVFNNSDVVFIDSHWQGNENPNRGGGLSLVFSRAEIYGGSFVGNRVNVDQHKVTAVGGGIYVTDSRLRVAGTRFENNQAAWVGGALYALGVWQEPLTSPAVEVQVFDSLFVGNRAQVADCCTVLGPTSGGAIHLEDHVTARIYHSRFEGNEAELGGAIDNYRGELEIEGSVFEGNFTTLQRSTVTAGGSLFLVSADFADSSTDFGAINRRPASLKLRNSLIRGFDGGTASAAQNGGCLFAAGDSNRLFGEGGVVQDGTVETNRAQVEIAGSAFFQCTSEAGGQPGSGFGGAINTRLAEVALRNSLVLDSQCVTDGCGGGGLAAFEDSLVHLDEATFAANAAFRGGGLFISGSTLLADSSRFFHNRISASDGTTNIINSRGAALFSIPGFNNQHPERARDARGLVSDSLFAGNLGLPIFEADTQQGPINDLRYDGNEFFSTLFSGKVFVNQLVRASGETVAQLNGLTVRRSNGSSTDKSLVANRSLASQPRDGQVLALPQRLFAPGDDGGVSPAATLAFAWVGGSAQLQGQTLGTTTGLTTTTQAGSFPLRVGSTVVSQAEVAAASCSAGPLLCLNQNRFRVGVDWQRTNGLAGLGLGVQLSPDTGYYTFFNEANVEMVLKVLRGCANNGNFWIFAGGLTNVETDIRVTDALTGQVRTYLNPQGAPFQPIQDIEAFPTCEALSAFQIPGSQEPGREIIQGRSALANLAGSASPTLLLKDDRFRVSARFRTPGGQEGDAQGIKLTADTGYFFFFNEANVEMVIKVLRGCGANGHYWVFAGGLTNVEVDLRVEDTSTGDVQVYRNPQRTPFQPIQDVRAFNTCP